MNNLFYRTLRAKNPKYKDDLLARYPKPQDLIEGLFLQAMIDAFQRIKFKPKVKSMIENEIRNLFIEDFKETNAPLNKYIQHNVITIASENQANTENLVQRTDIELHSNIHQIHFVIECKRLSSAETRYVQGTTKNGQYEIDGLEKFLHRQYAKNEPIASMVGFVVSGDVVKITSGLKQKIKAFHPAKTMKSSIDLQCINWEHSFQSVHIKTDRSSLLLYHLFFDFSK
jgi:hypothetical protein